MKSKGLLSVNCYYVSCAHLSGVFGVYFDIESNLLSLIQSFETFSLNSGKMNEYVIAAVIVCNEAKAFLRIKPLNCTLIHDRYLLFFNKDSDCYLKV